MLKFFPHLAFIAILLFAASQVACQPRNSARKNSTPMNTTTASLPQTNVNIPDGKAVATFGTGCFWCTEAVFQDLEGVEKVTSGYSGGHVANPTYEAVCDKTTGHAEVVQIIFDPAKISFDDLLNVFWTVHDPTTLNRQGNDVGPQYRSAIFYHSEEQKKQAEASKAKVDQEGIWDNPIVTEITSFTNFYAAEDYHDNYFKRVGDGNPYCSYVIAPKVDKFRKQWKGKLKKSE